MATAAWAAASRPHEMRKAGAGTPTSANFITYNSTAVDSAQIADPQPGRIIALHWLRPEKGEKLDA